MEPLSAMPEDVLRGVRGVAFDIDDTVTRGGRLEATAFEGMWRLRAAGMRLVAVTGRPLGWADVVARHWPVDLAVGENGAGWSWVGDNGLQTGYFEDDPETRARGQAALLGLRRAVATRLPDLPVADDQPARRCDLAFDVGEHRRATPGERRALLALIADRGLRATVSSVHAHAIPGAWDKARGLDRALPGVLGVDLGRERDRWLYVGDSPNDAPAFAAFPRSVGVANVRDHDDLPSSPRYVTEADRGRGFAELAEHLLAARASSSPA